MYALSPDLHLPSRQQSFVLRKAVPRLLLQRSFRTIFWTQKMPLLRKRRPPHSSWASRSETPARVHNTNCPADLSSCNGTSAILGQHKDSERTRPTRQQFVPLPIAPGAYDASLTYISDDDVLPWQPPSAFSQWTSSPFTEDLVEYSSAEQFMVASKGRLFGDESVFSAILATNDPREHKRLGRQVRHFDHDSWQHERENIALRANLAKFSQNEDLRLTLLHTGQCRLVEASPHDSLWGIGLRACDYRASSPGTWRGSNLLGQTLEHVRETIYRETSPQIYDPPPANTVLPLNHPNDIVFEVDPTTRARLNAVPITEHPRSAILSAFMDPAPDDHAPEVLLTNTTRADKPFISEQSPDLISGVVTMDDVTFTTLPSLTSGASTTSQFHCRALLDTGSPQSFIHQGAFEQMVATGAADESYVRSTPPRWWSGFDSQELLNTNRQARLAIQFYDNDAHSESLAVWIYIVPNKAMRCPLLLGRDSWMCFHSRSY